MEPGILLSIALALLAFGLVSRQAERSILTPPMWFVLVGLSVHTFGVLEVSVNDAAIHVLAELALVLVLFTDAARTGGSQQLARARANPPKPQCGKRTQ